MNNSDHTGTNVLEVVDEKRELTPYGERIRLIRNRLKINQGEFAGLAGVTVRAQRSYEAGLRTPNISYLEALASHHVDVGYILTGEERGAAARVLQPYSFAYHWLAGQLGLTETVTQQIADAFCLPECFPEHRTEECLGAISAEHFIGRIDPALLGKLLEAIEGLAPSLPMRKKAGIASLLYPVFRASGHFDQNAIKEAVDLAT